MFPKINGQPAEAPICLRGWGSFDMSKHRARLDNVKKHHLVADVYGIDAQWYGISGGSGNWFDDAGDWDVSEVIYPNGLHELSELAADAGLAFSAWMEHERVGKNSHMFHESRLPMLRDKDWALLDLGKAECRDYIFGKICSLIDETGMKVFRTDFNIAPAGVFAANDPEGRRGLTELRYYRGLYELLDRLLEKYPSLIIDNCASGGRRLDYEMGKRAFPIMCRSDYFCAQHDFGENGMQNMPLCLSRWLPVFGNSLGTGMQSGRTINVGDTYRLRSAITCGISIACPDFEMTEEEAAWYRKMLSDARRIREYMSRDFWPLGGASFCEKDLFAYQAADPESKSGMAAFFRRSECPVSGITLNLRAIIPDASYELEDIDAGVIGVMSGSELVNYQLSLPKPRSERIVFYRCLER